MRLARVIECSCSSIFISVVFHCVAIPLFIHSAQVGNWIANSLGLSHYSLAHIFLRSFLLDIFLEMDYLGHMLYEC